MPPFSRRDVLRLAALSAVAAIPRPLFAFSAFTSEVDAVLGAERFIRASQISTRDGITWPADPLKPEEIDRSFYNGTPGVVLFYVALWQATGDARYLETARRGADDLIAHLNDSSDPGLYSGLAGTAFVLAQLGDDRYTAAARRALDAIDVGKADGNDIISGYAGIGLTLLAFKDVAGAARCGDLLLAQGTPANGGLKWAAAPTVPTLYPNFSHGTAGVAYFLATLYDATHKRQYLDAALAGARYLDAVATVKQSGYKVFHHEPGGEDLYYLSWCHGPAGTARLFYRLHRVTGDAKWLERVHECARGIIDAGVPEQRSPGYWNNISQCCGDAGVGEFFLALQRVAPRAEYVAMVERCRTRILDRATAEGDAMKWVQAEHRVKPELLIAQTGFMQGAAGVGTFLLRARQSSRTIVALPDNPFA